jgi:hypothetical protein
MTFSIALLKAAGIASRLSGLKARFLKWFEINPEKRLLFDKKARYYTMKVVFREGFGRLGRAA